jgi:hypothetical protein
MHSGVCACEARRKRRRRQASERPKCDAMTLQLALVASLAVLGGCRYHIGCAHSRPNDPNALFEWKGVFHMMWQGDGGWDHATSADMARWTKVTQPANHRKGQPAIAGPSGWDGSMTIIPSIDGGQPVALFDCIPGKDAVGIKSASCSNYSSPGATASTGNDFARRPALNFGDPSFIGIARPVDANDPNLTATWRKDPRGHISILNETGGTALGFSGPSPIWKAANGEYRMVMTYGPGHTGMFCSTDPSLFDWTVCADTFYPDRDAGGAMFLALPPLPPGDKLLEQQTKLVPYTHLLFGVTPGLGKGVAALGVYDDANRTFSNTTGPPPGHDLRPLTFEEKFRNNNRLNEPTASGPKGCGGAMCGMDANDNPVCCSDLAAGYKKATYDAGDVRFGQVWVDPATKRMTWFAWAGAAYLQTTVRDMFYDPVRQDLLMYPVPAMATLRGGTPLGVLSGETVHRGQSVVALFTGNSTTFDVEATVELPSSGAAVEFNVLLLASPAQLLANNFSSGAMVNVKVGAAAAGSTTRFVSMSTLIAGRTRIQKKFWPTNLTTTNFTMPSAPGGAPSSIEVRMLVDTTMVEVFVAKGRGVITQSLTAGGRGVYFMGGQQGPTQITRAVAWDMGWVPCAASS